MNSREQRLKILFDRWYDQQLTEEDKPEFLALLKLADKERKLEPLMKEAYENLQPGYFFTPEQIAEMAAVIMKKERGIVRQINWRKIAVAASIFLVVCLGSYVIFFNKNKHPEVVQSQEQRFKNDVDPGTYKARLRLADGREIVLDSTKMGELTTQGGTVVLNKDGQLVYEVNSKTNEIFYNTLTTAKGETYATVLADGSKVWLNSASSIKFPVAFNGNERRVEITGEAYFEVAKDASKKFFVTGNGVTTEVLGTHFNVNTYTTEATIRVTLLEGSVKVSKGSSTGVLTPGQQAQVANDIKVLTNIDLDEVMAWKNGRFYFENSSLETIMHQLERWYDIEVDYKSKIPHLFVAKIPRDVPVSELLKLLELTELVHFKIEGKKITVMK